MSWYDIPVNLRNKYLRVGAMKVARLVRLLDHLQGDPADLDTLRALLHCFHGLSGWDGVDGLPMVALAAEMGAHDCSTLLRSNVVPESRHLDQIKALIYLLRQEIRQQRLALEDVAPEAAATSGGPRRSSARTEPLAAAEPPSPAEAVALPAHRALLVGLPEEAAESLGRLLAFHGIALDAVETSFEAGRLLARSLPDALIAAAELADGTGYVLADYVRGMPGGQRPVVVILGAYGRGCDPAELVRCGIDAYIAAPASGATLAEALADRLDHQRQAPRVLCLSERPDEALALRTQLEEAGYRVRLCTDPRRLPRLATSFDAELVLMDMPRPDGTASDLVRRLRQDPHSAVIPIVLLTGGEPLLPVSVPSLIGTEYLAKPVEAPQLIAAVANRIERSRALRQLFADGVPSAQSA